MSSESLSGKKSRPVPFLPRETWAHLLKGVEHRTLEALAGVGDAPKLAPCEPVYAFCLLDPFMRFVLVSPVVAELTGYSLKELSCMGLQEIISLDFMESTLTAFEKTDNLGWSHHRVRFYRKDGVEVEARIDSIRLLDDQYLIWIREVRSRTGKALKAG